MNRTKKSIWEIPTFAFSLRFACFSTAALSATAIFLMHKREWDLRSAPYYKETIERWQDHKAAKYIIGEPITLKSVEKFHPANHINDEKAKFFIPLTGKNYNGKLNVNATCKDTKWTLHELSLELDSDLSDKKFIVYREKNETSEKNEKTEKLEKNETSEKSEKKLEKKGV